MALRASEERYRSIFENALEGIFRFVPRERFSDVNPALVQMLGYASKENVLALDLAHDLYMHADEFHEMLDRLQTNAVVKNAEVTWKKNTGDPIIVSINSRVIRDAQGHIVCYEGMMQDVTERKRAEDEIRSLNAELEARVKERTTELQLANRELKDFAYVVSHDLKAPLRAISRLASWLREDYAPAFDDKGHEMVDLLIGRVKRMDHLIDGILEYSRIDRVGNERVPVDLNQIVADVIDSLAPPEHVHITVAHELPSLIIGKTQIFQVFQNLIGNAIKFMDKPQGQIELQCVEDDGNWRFSVSDNGPGIDPKYHDRIFKIFQTLHPRDEFESTGIGLALVKKIVEFHGGKIWLESTGEKGSQFFFTLPQN